MKQWKIKNRTGNIHYTYSKKSEERFRFIKLNWILIMGLFWMQKSGIPVKGVIGFG